jgi:hypothetical protein
MEFRQLSLNLVQPSHSHTATRDKRDATFAFQQAHKEVRIHVLSKEKTTGERDTVGKSLFLVGLKVDAIIHLNAIIQNLMHGENLELGSFGGNFALFLYENCRVHFFPSAQKLLDALCNKIASINNLTFIIPTKEGTRICN